MNKIWVNFIKNLLKTGTCFSRNFRNVWLFDEIQVGAENNFNKFWLICTIYKDGGCFRKSLGKFEEKFKGNFKNCWKHF